MRVAAATSAAGTAAKPAVAEPPPRTDRRAIGLLSLTHAAVDLNPSALAALLPAFYVAFHLSFGATALITAISQVTNSACQLPFGFLADRLSLRRLIPAGCLLAGLGLALAGLAPSYHLLLLAICLSGLGVAMFHPQAARTTNRVSGRRRATAMSFFSVGGNAGFALGPLAATLAAPGLTRGSTLLFLVPSLLMLVTLRLLDRPLPAEAPAERNAQRRPAAAGERGQLALLMGLTVIRSALQVGILTFVPLYEVTALHNSQLYASALMTAFLACGAAGTLLGGAAADRYGRPVTVLASFLLSAPLLLVFRTTTGPLAFLALALAGGFLLSTFAVTVVMGQELLPHRTGVAAGLTIGFASGVGGAAVGGLGHLADVAGLAATLNVLVILAMVAGIGALGLGRGGRISSPPSPDPTVIRGAGEGETPASGYPREGGWQQR